MDFNLETKNRDIHVYFDEIVYQEIINFCKENKISKSKFVRLCVQEKIRELGE